jgi:alpha-1,2-mannosyltransferase
VADYARERVRLWSVGALWAGLLLTLFNLYAALSTYLPQFRVRNDFRLVYGAALDGWTYGYSHLYDLTIQKQVIEGLGQGTYWSPYLNPPPLAWLGTLFLPLPFEAATVLWTALLVGAALLAWRLAAPGDNLARAAHLALFCGLFPTAFGLMVGQPVALVAAAVALTWWLTVRKHPALAGLALSLIAIKPQLALLVPLCLLVSGHWRVVAVWAAATAVIVAVALVLLGGEGLQRYRDALALASQWEPTRSDLGLRSTSSRRSSSPSRSSPRGASAAGRSGCPSRRASSRRCSSRPM